MTLPTIPSPDRPRETPALAAGPTRPLRVLVVEDMVASARLMAAMLRRFWGHEVRLAHDGLSALEAAVGFGPEVILLDIGLPGMSGYEVAQRIRENKELRHVMLVALTGYGAAADVSAARSAGFDAHIVKPADIARIQELLSSLRAPAN